MLHDLFVGQVGDLDARHQALARPAYAEPAVDERVGVGGRFAEPRAETSEDKPWIADEARRAAKRAEDVWESVAISVCK